MITVAPLYAALAGFMLAALSIHVIRGRRQYRVPIGDNSVSEMTRRIRAQGNFVEYTPLFLIMLGYAEYNGLPFYAAHLFGMVFLAGRMMHAYSLLKHEQYDNGRLLVNPVWRIRGMGCTLTAILLLGLILIAQFIF